MVEKELSECKMVARTAAGMTDFKQWWRAGSIGDEDVNEKFPCLTRVAAAFRGTLAGAGGLECDIGQLGNLVTPLRGRLCTGHSEMQLLIRVSKNLIECNTDNIKDLGKEWKSHVPKRPCFDVSENQEETGNEEEDDESEPVEFLLFPENELDDESTDSENS